MGPDILAIHRGSSKDDAEKDEQTPESPFKADVFEAEEASPIATDSSTTWEADLEEHPLQLGAAIDARENKDFIIVLFTFTSTSSPK